MVTNRKINFSGSYIICGKKSSSLTYFGKRTTLNSKNIGPKFCFRSMRTSLKTALLESNRVSRQLSRASSRILSQTGEKKTNFRTYATRAEVENFEREYKIRIRMTQSYDLKIKGHFCFQDDGKEGVDILTHWGSKNLIVCDGDVIGNPSFIEHKTRFQKVIEQKCWTRALKKLEYERLNLQKTKTSLILMRIMRKDPEVAKIMQDFFSFCKKDTQMSRLEKNAFITSVVKDLIKSYKDK